MFGIGNGPATTARIMSKCQAAISNGPDQEMPTMRLFEAKAPLQNGMLIVYTAASILCLSFYVVEGRVPFKDA